MKTADALFQLSLHRGRGRFLGIALLLIAASAAAPLAQAAGTVIQCDEANFKAQLFGGGTVKFNCSGTIALLGGTAVISTNTIIDGNGQAVTLSGAGQVQLFQVNPGASLTLRNLTLANGNAVSNGSSPTTGGAVYVQNGASATVDGCTFQNNATSVTSGAETLAFYGGGAIFNENGTLVVK